MRPSFEERKKLMKGEIPCTCGCHQDGVMMMHIMPCCPYGGKWIDKDGKVDMDRWNKIKNRD